MSNVIGFLERMGQDAQLRHADNIEIEQALTREQIDDELRSAILGSDQVKLESLLGARTNVYCLIAPGKKDDEEEEDSPDRDDDEITQSCARTRHMASLG